MVRGSGSRPASAPGTAPDPPPDSTTTALVPSVPAPPRGRGTSSRRGRGGGRAGAAAAVDAHALVRRSDVAPCLTCGICDGLLRDATAISECLHSFCRQCIYDKLTEEDKKCPTCGILLGPAPLEKLRSVLFHCAKRRNVNVVTTENKKRKGKVSTESTLSSVVNVAIRGCTMLLPQKLEVEVINVADEASVAQESVYKSSTLNLAPVGRDVLSRIRCQDFYSACNLNAETGALIVWQPKPIPEEMVAHDQLAPKQDPQDFVPPVTSDTEYQRQAPATQMTNTPVVAGSSFHARMPVQDDDNLKGDILALFNESTARIMGRYDAEISQLKAGNSKLIELLENERAAALERTRILEGRHQQELENERAAAAERTRMLEERHQQELENERAAAAERTRTLEERLQRESEIATSARNTSRSLEAQNARLHEDLENGRADNQALMSDIAEKSDELATLKNHCDMLESDKKDLENQVENLKKELEYTKREHARYARQVLDAASRVPIIPMQLAGVDPPCTISSESTGPRSKF